MMEVLVKITAGKLLSAGVWEEFCNLRSINEWAVSEGLMDPDEEFTLSMEEADKLGLLPLDLEQLLE